MIMLRSMHNSPDVEILLFHTRSMPAVFQDWLTVLKALGKWYLWPENLP